MFVGHYSVAFACRTERNGIPLWVLFIAVQFLDYIWATLVLLGIEKLRVIKGFTAGSMLDSYFHPYSHSLITAILWSVVAALIYKAVCGRHPFDSAQGRLSRYSKSAPLIIGIAVFSHWILDLIAHPRDLAIYDNTWKVGFGLWNYRNPEFALEIALLAGGIILYLVRNVMPGIRKGAVIGFGLAVRCSALVRSSKSCPSPSPLLIHRPIYPDSVFPASSDLQCLPLGRRKLPL
jgi:hypothetical protein